MSQQPSSRQFDEFFNESGFRKYERYRSDPKARVVFEWLRDRIELLVSSIRNHKKPALQGVIVDLEEILRSDFGWTKATKDNFFITMIGAMVCYLVQERGFTVKRTGVLLRNSSIISTAATYESVNIADAPVFS